MTKTFWYVFQFTVPTAVQLQNANPKFHSRDIIQVKWKTFTWKYLIDTYPEPLWALYLCEILRLHGSSYLREPTAFMWTFYTHIELPIPYGAISPLWALVDRGSFVIK